MGKASNFENTDATKRRKEIVNECQCGKQIFKTRIIRWKLVFFLQTVEKHIVYNFFRVWKNKIVLRLKFHTSFKRNYFESGLLESAVLIG